MHVLENTLHSNEKRKGSKWNRIDSLEGWGFKDRRERGSIPMVSSKKTIVEYTKKEMRRELEYFPTKKQDIRQSYKEYRKHTAKLQKQVLYQLLKCKQIKHSNQRLEQGI